MNSKVYMQRHGESTNNVKKIFTCKRLDPGLTEHGIVQITDKCAFYKLRGIDKIVSSPSKRAEESAKIIASSLKLDYSIDKDLLEVDVGSLEGKSELNETNISLYNQILEKLINGECVSFPNGEGLFYLNSRINRVIDNYFCLNHNTILVGHATLFTLLLNNIVKIKAVQDIVIKRAGIIEYSVQSHEWKQYE